MATPAVSGFAVLVRQYLADGWYPSGTKTPSDSWVRITSSLLKAILIQSTVPVTGAAQVSHVTVSGVSTADGQIPLNDKPYPTMYSGFGRIQLDSVLYFNDTSGTKNEPKLVLIQDVVISAAGDTDRYCFSVTNPTAVANPPLYDLKVTLAWTDPPGTIASGYVLMNDLDLIVMDDTGTVYYASSTLDKAYNMLGRKFDRVNNVEQVLVPFYSSTTGGTRNYYVYVYSNRIVSSQKYSLVVSTNAYDLTTSLTNKTCLTSTPCPNNCTRSLDATSQCVNGLCTCGSASTGVDCSIAVNQLQSCSAVAKRIPYQQIAYYTYTKNGGVETKVIINVREDNQNQFQTTATPSINTQIYVSTTGYPTKSGNTWSGVEYSSTVDNNYVNITGLAAGVTLYIAVYGNRQTPAFLDAYTMAFEVGVNDPITPITALGTSVQGCVAVNRKNRVSGSSASGTDQTYVYGYYSITKTVVDAALGSADKSSAILRFDLDGYNNDVTGYLLKVTSGGVNTKPSSTAYSNVISSTGFLEVAYNTLFTANIVQLNMAVLTNSSGPFTLTVGAVQPACSSTNAVTITTLTPTTISSQVGNGFYTASQTCTWVLSPSNSAYSNIKLVFNSFSLAFGDTLYIYSGSAVVQRNLIWTLDGYSIPAPIILANTPSVTLQFVSDGNWVADTGFSLTYTPLQTVCPNNCNSRGTCTGNQCVCADGYYGIDCSLSGCPSANCTGNGQCSGSVCKCKTGYWGYNCENICPGGVVNPCNGRAVCNRKTGACGTCSENSYGPACQYLSCPSGCPTGQCDAQTGTCICSYGTYGSACSQTCPGGALNPCNGKGQCVDGVCICNSGAFGTACDAIACTKNCGNGTCDTSKGTCVCPTGYYGDKCASICPRCVRQ
jgi:hypothetical protein